MEKWGSGGTWKSLLGSQTASGPPDDCTASGGPPTTRGSLPPPTETPPEGGPQGLHGLRRTPRNASGPQGLHGLRRTPQKASGPQGLHGPRRTPPKSLWPQGLHGLRRNPPEKPLPPRDCMAPQTSASLRVSSLKSPPPRPVQHCPHPQVPHFASVCFLKAWKLPLASAACDFSACAFLAKHCPALCRAELLPLVHLVLAQWLVCSAEALNLLHCHLRVQDRPRESPDSHGLLASGPVQRLHGCPWCCLV